MYSISTNGVEKVLHSFGSGSDGVFPYAGLIHVVETGNDTLYGTTREGGTSDRGTVYSVGTNGAEKVLHSFSAGSDGSGPFGGLVAVRNTLYGTTFLGGGDSCYKFGCGTVYSISRDGAETVLYSLAATMEASPKRACSTITARCTVRLTKAARMTEELCLR